MIGAVYLNQLNQMLAEFASGWVDIKTSFDYLYEAAKDFSKETRACHSSQTITTVAGLASYNLNPDFREIMTKDDSDNFIVAYSDGTYTSWLSWEGYSTYLQNNNSAGTPFSFSITDAVLPDRITGTVTTGHAQVGGESVLTDSAATFTSLYPGDSIINTSQSYYGLVLKNSTTLTTAMFDISARTGATYKGWTLADIYLIQPAPRYMLVLDPTPSVSGKTVTVTYYAKPLPVYSDYGSYPFATGYEGALIKYAAWLYKYRDSKPSLADPLYMAYEKEMRKGKNVNRKATGTVGFRVSWMK